MYHERPKYVLNQRGRAVELSLPWIMGVVNVTPDSFYAGSRRQGIDDVMLQVRRMVSEGVDIVDLGAMTSKPGADILSVEKEWERLEGIISEIKAQWPELVLSIDTLHAETAHRALSAGADWINDISGGTYDDEMASVVASAGAPFVCMHMRGEPKTMQSKTEYGDLVTDMYVYFSRQIRALRGEGVRDIIIDPGFGFAKTVEQNFELLGRLHLFHSLDCPLLVGVSRKSMIYRTLNLSPEEALNGSTVLHTIALMQGIHILRVHDVKEAREAALLSEKVRRGFGFYEDKKDE